MQLAKKKLWNVPDYAIVGHVNGFSQGLYTYRTWGKWRFQVRQKMSHLTRVHSQSILGPPGNLSDRSLSGSEGTRGQNTRGDVWGKVQRPNENGRYSLRPRSTNLLQELGRGFRLRKTTSKNGRRQVKELLGSDLCSQKTWVCALSLPLTSCGASGKSPTCFQPPLPQSTLLISGFCRINKDHVKTLQALECYWVVVRKKKQ